MVVTGTAKGLTVLIRLCDRAELFSGGFADIFEEMLGAMGAGRRSQNGPARGSDLRYNIEVSL